MHCVFFHDPPEGENFSEQNYQFYKIYSDEEDYTDDDKK